MPALGAATAGAGSIFRAAFSAAAEPAARPSAPRSITTGNLSLIQSSLRPGQRPAEGCNLHLCARGNPDTRADRVEWASIAEWPLAADLLGVDVDLRVVVVEKGGVGGQF